MFREFLKGMLGAASARKGQAGGLVGVIFSAGQPAIDAFLNGFAAGSLPQIEMLGTVMGKALIGYAVGYVVTWLAPKNTPLPSG